MQAIGPAILILTRNRLTVLRFRLNWVDQRSLGKRPLAVSWPQVDPNEVPPAPRAGRTGLGQQAEERFQTADYNLRMRRAIEEQGNDLSVVPDDSMILYPIDPDGVHVFTTTR